MNDVGVAAGDAAPAEPGTPEQHEAITLGVLNAVEGNSALTQRSVARDLGIALGLANAYLKRAARKGWIKIQQVPPNRYAYYLTPKGFAEKSRLTAQYLSISFNFFRHARQQCAALFAECAARGWRRVALAGAGDLAEIAALCAAEHKIEIAGIIDRARAGGTFAGLRVVGERAELGPVDGVILTDLAQPQDTFDALAAAIGADTVLAPRLLNISRTKPTLVE